MASGWQCIKVGTAAASKIVHIAPWMVAAYLAAHPMPANCDAECHYVIPPAEFQPGGMFGPDAPQVAPVTGAKPGKKAEKKPDEVATYAVGGTPRDEDDPTFVPIGPLITPLNVDDPGGGGGGGGGSPPPLPPTPSPLPPLAFPPTLVPPTSTPPGSEPPPTSQPVITLVAVPEPAGALLSISGLIGLALFRRRRTQ